MKKVDIAKLVMMASGSKYYDNGGAELFLQEVWENRDVWFNIPWSEVSNSQLFEVMSVEVAFFHLGGSDKVSSFEETVSQFGEVKYIFRSYYPEEKQTGAVWYS
jgi:hypothetical protein